MKYLFLIIILTSFVKGAAFDARLSNLNAAGTNTVTTSIAMPTGGAFGFIYYDATLSPGVPTIMGIWGSEFTIDGTPKSLRLSDGFYDYLDAHYTAQTDFTTLQGVVATKTTFSGAYSALTGKPTLFTGNYSDLIGAPALFSGAYADLSGKPTLFSGAYADLTGKPTLFSGSYTDLTSKPTIPAAQVNSDWSASSGLTQILNKPTLFSGSYADLTGKPTLFSGAYGDLTGKPTIPSAQVQSDWNASTGVGVVLNKPTIPTNTNQLTNGSGFITDVVTSLGYTPYNATNPNGYTSNTGTVTSIVAGTGLNGGTIISTGTISLSSVGTAGTYGLVTTDAQGRVTAGKRQEAYSGTTNASGIYAVTFATAYSVAPNIQINPISGSNKETQVTTVTTTGFSIYCQLRADVLGLVPSYSNVSGRSIDVLVTEK